jgi:hypothetical protein
LQRPVAFDQADEQKKHILEQMIGLCLLAYTVGVWFGEAIRDVVYGELAITEV